MSNSFYSVQRSAYPVRKGCSLASDYQLNISGSSGHYDCQSWRIKQGGTEEQSAEASAEPRGAARVGGGTPPSECSCALLGRGAHGRPGKTLLQRSWAFLGSKDPFQCSKKLDEVLSLMLWQNVKLHNYIILLTRIVLSISNRDDTVLLKG